MANSNDRAAPFGGPAPNCFQCQWRERSEWCVLARDDVQVLNDHKITSIYEPGQYIFRQGDPCSGVYSIVAGAIAIRKSDPHGHAVLVRMRHGGETIGYRDFFAGEIYTTSAEALSRCRVCFIDKRSVRGLLDRNPALGLGFLHRMASDLQEAEETLLQSASLNTRTRMAHLLLALKDRYATAQEDGSLTMKLPLSRQDIADILGSRPETVARIIQAFEKDDVARFSGRNVIIPDLDALLDEIDPDGD
jgi:CRP/FNR family transcriptional regulator